MFVFLSLSLKVSVISHLKQLSEASLSLQNLKRVCACSTGLTEVLPAPDVHGSVILAEVIEPGPVNHKEPACDDGSPVEKQTRGGSVREGLARKK